MPKATATERAAFASALADAIRDKAIHLDAGLRTDEWLAEQIDMSGQAIRNYLAGIREPNRRRVAQMEDALDVPRNSLGRHLGIGVSETDRLDLLEARVDGLAASLERALRLLEAISPPESQPRRSRPRAGRSGS